MSILKTREDIHPIADTLTSLVACIEQIFQLLFKETKNLSSEEFDDMKLSSNFSYDDAALVNNAQTSMVSDPL
jgi:hypothetical protein